MTLGDWLTSAERRYARAKVSLGQVATNAHDEALFDYYFTSQLTRVDLADGKATAVGSPGVISGFGVSPDGQYVLTNRLKRPYSYLVPASQFPTEIAVSTIDGQPVNDEGGGAFAIGVKQALIGDGSQ